MMISFRFFAGVALILASVLASALQSGAEPTFDLKISGQSRQWTASELMRFSASLEKKVRFPKYYQGQTLNVRLVPIGALIKASFPTLVAAQGQPNETQVLLKAKDGFSVQFALSVLTSDEPGRQRALLAIEPLNKNSKLSKWPILKEGPGRGNTAGPFAVLWENEDPKQIGPEQWPFQVVSIESVEPIETRYPEIVPQPISDKAQAARVQLGYQTFLKNCFVCHSLNLQGEGQIGPDLNWPQSPTEYFKVDHLKQLIRNPSQLRAWDRSSMPAFSSEVLSDTELESLISYLSHMAKHRPKQLPKAQPDSKQK